MSIGQNTATAEKLTSFLERLEHLLDEIDGLKENLKDLKAEVRDDGFNVAAVLRLVAIRRDKRRASQENELLNDLVLYAHASGTPLDFAFADEDLSPGGSGNASREGAVPAREEGIALAE